MSKKILFGFATTVVLVVALVSFANSVVAQVEEDRELKLTNPNGGEVWIFGKEYKIKWDAKNISGDLISIELLPEDRNSFCWIGAAQASSESFKVRINESASLQCPEGNNGNISVPAGNYEVLLNTSKGDTYFQDRSNNFFTIKQDPRKVPKTKPEIELQSPSGALSYSDGSKRIDTEVFWTADGFSEKARFFMAIKDKEGKTRSIKIRDSVMTANKDSGFAWWEGKITIPTGKLKDKSNFQFYICGKDRKTVVCDSDTTFQYSKINTTNNQKSASIEMTDYYSGDGGTTFNLLPVRFRLTTYVKINGVGKEDVRFFLKRDDGKSLRLKAEMFDLLSEEDKRAEVSISGDRLKQGKTYQLYACIKPKGAKKMTCDTGASFVFSEGGEDPNRYFGGKG